jgi:hypothetical protein
MSELEKPDNKNNFMKQFESLRPDLFFPDPKLTPPIAVNDIVTCTINSATTCTVTKKG